LLLEVSARQEDRITVRASSGGIPPIYILRNNSNVVEEVLISGLPLGITTEAIYTSTEFSLTSGDAMLLMSDGLPETFNQNGEILGLIRLKNKLQQLNLACLAAPEILGHVAHIGDDWAAGHPLHDDATLVVIKAK
jgi:serine phosphatase RsbU (regulator of sigma subunit)